MSRKLRPQWTSRDTEAAATLELPLLLVLQREVHQAVLPLSALLGRDEAPVRRALQQLCSKGLAHRRETRYPPRFMPLGDGEVAVTQEKIIRRWVLSERGAAWRDRRIARGDLAKLPERYQALGATYAQH